MSRITELLEKVRDRGHGLWIGGPASPEAILGLEGELGVKLSPVHRAFLEVYGSMAIGDEFVSGILDDEPLATKSGGIYGDTVLLRHDSPEMPSNLWVILKHEDGAYCMDVARPTDEGEFAFVNYECGPCQHEKPIASSFEEFLCEWFLEGWADEPA